ncbi:MAG: winged helix-turn-helix transcriptional regulator, partial [bacterium]
MKNRHATQNVIHSVNLSQNACWRRIRRLEEEGIIKKRVVLRTDQKTPAAVRHKLRTGVAGDAFGGARDPIKGKAAIRLGTAGIDDIRGNLRDVAKTLFVLPQRRFRLLAVGDVAQHHAAHRRAGCV